MARMDPASLIDPASWWERWGAMGLIASLSLIALYYVVRYYLRERSVERDRAEGERRALQALVDGQRQALAEAHQQMVMIVQQNHAETLESLAAQRSEHDERYEGLMRVHQGLLERVLDSAARNQETAAAVTRTLDSLTQRLRGQ